MQCGWEGFGLGWGFGLGSGGVGRRSGVDVGIKDESEETGDRLTASAHHSFLPFKMIRMKMNVITMTGCTLIFCELYSQYQHQF